jgi:enolase
LQVNVGIGRKRRQWPFLGVLQLQADDIVGFALSSRDDDLDPSSLTSGSLCHRHSGLCGRGCFQIQHSVARPANAHPGGIAWQENRLHLQQIASPHVVLHAANHGLVVPAWRYLAGNEPVRMPLPEIQIFGGGADAGRRTDIQDFLVMPVGARSFDEALSMCAVVYRAAGELMSERGRLYGVADEGGWWPAFDSNEDALASLASSIDRAGYRHGEVMISLDVAASEFGRGGQYRLALEDETHDTAGWLGVLRTWIERYPILSVEDPVAEDDAEGMREFTASLGRRVPVIGDDFLVTNARRVAAAAMVPAQPGDRFEANVQGLGTVRAVFGGSL